jgi:glutathione S-transferase
MIVVHHLNDSRSQRILWLLEELGLPYEIKPYQRDSQTRLAPPELKKVHMLGKSPVITDAYDEYVQWMHYAEGSAMLPLMLNLYAGRLGQAAAPLMPRIESEMANHLAYIDSSLKGRQFLVGDSLTGADIQMSFVGEVAGAFGQRAKHPNLDAWTKRLHERPAYKKALEKGGAYNLAN